MTDRVLLVDDDVAVREALGQTLELADLRPVLAGSYIEAKDHVSTEFAGVVVTDIRMPGKDGFALLDHRATGGCRSAGDPADRRRRCADGGAGDLARGL